MTNRSQLNINIDPQLLKLIKHCALKSDMTIGDYINNIIKCYLTNKDLQAISIDNENRLNKIEKKLLETNQLLKQLIDNSNDENFNKSLTDIDGTIYCNLLAKQFKLIARNNMISTKEAWKLFMLDNAAKNIKADHIPIIQDTLREEAVLPLKELIGIVKLYNYCPVIPVFYSMTNGNILPELVNLSNRLIAAAMD